MRARGVVYTKREKGGHEAFEFEVHLSEQTEGLFGKHYRAEAAAQATTPGSGR